MTRSPEQVTDNVNNQTEPHVGCDGRPVVRDPHSKRPIITLRRVTRLLALIAAIVLCVALIDWPQAPKLLPSLSPFMAVTIIFAQKTVGWIALLSLPIVISAIFSRRWFCRYLCPMGVVTDCASRHQHGRRLLRRIPNIAPLIVLLTWSGALIGLSLTNWIDPLNIFGAAIGVGKSWIYTVGLILAVAVSLLIPSIWCLKICPLGAVQDLTSRLARTISRTFRPFLPPANLRATDDDDENEDEQWGDEYDDSMFDVKLSELEEGNHEREITAGIVDETNDTTRQTAARETQIDSTGAGQALNVPESKIDSPPPSETTPRSSSVPSDSSHSTDYPRPPHKAQQESHLDETDRSDQYPLPNDLSNKATPEYESTDSTTPSKDNSSSVERSASNADSHTKHHSESSESGPSRRSILILFAGIATLAVAGVARVGRGIANRVARLRPPGAVDDSQFLALCIRCGNCQAACPTSIIRPSQDLSRPLELGTPIIDFHHDGFCEETCTGCGITCPSGAIRTIDQDEKVDFPIGIASIDSNWCLLADNKECKICKRECQYDAIEYLWSDESYTLTPIVDSTLCTGCGRCMTACPADRDAYPDGAEAAPSEKAIQIVVRTGEEISPPAK